MSAFRAGRWNAYAAVAAASQTKSSGTLGSPRERVRAASPTVTAASAEVGDEQQPAPVDRVRDRARDDRDREQRDERGDPEQPDQDRRAVSW